MTDDKKDHQSAEDVIAENMKKSKGLDEKFTAEFFNSVRSEKARKLFPERGGEKFSPSWTSVLFGQEGRENTDKFRCERSVYNVLTQSKKILDMHEESYAVIVAHSTGMTASTFYRVEVDIRRHISCEVCDESVTGGYDPFLNQVVICQNRCKSETMMQGVLTHELIHMFDYCRRKLDLNDIKHLACTEIRAANLAHCSFLSAVSTGAANFVNIKERHQECVKQKAVASVLAVKNVTFEEAVEAVDSVFKKCYNDLEPLGRRLRRNSDHIDKAYLDRLNMGYY